jgi:HEAT repeat protein
MIAIALALVLCCGAHAGEAAPGTPAGKEGTVSLEPAPGDDAATRQLKQNFSQALALIDAKKYAEAAEQLQNAIAVQPDNKLIADFYAIAVGRFLDAALKSDNAELKAQAERLQKMAYKGRVEQLRNAEHVKRLVKSLRKGFLERTFAMEELIIAGDYAVPHLVQFLIEDQDTEHRAYAEYVLSRLGATATPPICEALKYDDPMVRQILIESLQAIGDTRAVPCLLWLVQQPEGHPLVVSAAKQAVLHLSEGDQALLSKPAPLAFLDLAQDYYYQNQQVLLPHLYEHLVWRWDPDAKRLTSETVPRKLYPYRMAEEAARNALLADGSFEPAIPLLICSLFGQQNLLENFYTAAEGQDLSEQEQRDIELARPIRERLKVAPLVAESAGKKFLYAGLRRSLRDGRSLVAISCIESLRQVADGSALPRKLAPGEEPPPKAGKKEQPKRRKAIMTWYGPKDRVETGPPPKPVSRWEIPLDGEPLIEALGHPNKFVRYAAANALVAIAPTHVIKDADFAIANLAEAITETTARVALLVDEDNAMLDKMRGFLRDAGVFPELARGERDALKLARELPPEDVIIINGQLQATDPVGLLASLRQVYTLAGVPVLVIATEETLPKLKKQFEGEKATFLVQPISADSVRAAIDRVLEKAPEPSGQKQITGVSSRAARSLASIDPETSTFDVAQALPALGKAVANATQPDAVRIPAAQAIRHIGDPEALSDLTAAYKSPKSSKDLKLTLLPAIGACSARGALSDEIAQLLHGAAGHEDFDFRRAAAFAFGLAGGASEQMIRVVDELHGSAPKAAAEPAAPAAE